MREEIQVYIRGVFREGSPDQEMIETVSCGIFRTVAGKKHILFEERLGENGETAKSHLIISENGVELRRSGAAEASFFFQPGKTTPLSYATAYGTLPLGVKTESLLIEEDSGRLEIGIQYELISGGEALGRYRADIKICNK